MRNKKTEAIIILCCGLICIAAALYVYLVAHTIHTDSDSSRILDLNRLLRTFGRRGTSILIAIPGLIMIYVSIKKLSK
jgi:hypothetical protein